MNFQKLLKPLALLVFFSVSVSAFAAEPESYMIDVNGASLEYLDWGGEGPPMLFLAGASDTPYIFNDLAPEFTSEFHAYGLTRRGHGRSEKSPSGYTLEEMVADVERFLDIMNLTEVVLVGHSYGALEVMRFVQLFPDRVSAAVVLDIAYAFQNSEDEPSGEASGQLVGVFMPFDELGASLDNYRRFLTWNHRSWSEAAEANLREQAEILEDGSLVGRMPDFVAQQFGDDRQNWFLTHIPAPTLFVFSNNPSVDLAEGLSVDPALMNELAEEDAALSAQRRIQINAIKRDSPHARFVELDHTSHRNFIHRHDRVTEEMWQFLR